MCREHVITFDGCRHEASDKRLCPAAEREAARVQKRATWCCIPIEPPKRRVVCEVEYKTHRKPGFCEHCRAAQRRERARQVRGYREESKRRAAADQLEKNRQQKQKIKEAETRATARQTAELYKRRDRAAPQDDGESYIENPLYAEIMDLLTGPEYQKHSPPPWQSAARQETRSGRPQTPSRPEGRAPPPLSTRRVRNYPGRNAQGSTPTPAPAPATLPAPCVGMATHRGQMAGARRPELQVITNANVRPRNQVVQNGGNTAPLPLQKQKHAPMNYGESTPDDEFLDFAEQYA